jgi:hypothetical protein
MLYAFICTDRPDGQELRLANRSAHVAYLESQGAALITAGPLLADDGQAMVGSLLIRECADRAEAEAFAAGDPYAQAGLFAAVTIRPWRRVFPR